MLSYLTRFTSHPARLAWTMGMVVLLLLFSFGLRLPQASAEVQSTEYDAFAAVVQPDGRLNLERADGRFFHPAGWRMLIAADGSPLFFQPPTRTLANPIGSDSDWNRFFSAAGVSGGTATVYAVYYSASHGLYIGGDFTQAGGVTVNYIAHWDPTTGAWSALGNGFNGVVYDIVPGPAPLATTPGVPIDGIYVSGAFTTDSTGTTTYNRVAYWDFTTSSWSVLGNGVGGSGETAYCVAVVEIPSPIDPSISDYYLVTGGDITKADPGGSDTPVNYVAYYDISNGGWDKLLADSETQDGTNGPVYDCVGDGEKAYLGGSFSTAGDNSYSYLAGFDFSLLSSSWLNFTNGPAGTVYALATHVTQNVSPGQHRLYVGGSFLTPFSRLGWCDLGTTRSCQGMTSHYPNDTVRALSILAQTLLVGGDFTSLAPNVGYTTINSSYLAHYTIDHTSLDNVAQDSDQRGYTDGSVYAVSADHWFVGGTFTTIADTQSSRPSYAPATLQVHGIAGMPASGTARWLPLGGGMDNSVYAVAVDGSTYYIGGTFTRAGGGTVNYIARWNSTDNTWDLLGGGVNGPVLALLVTTDKVYVGGSFSQATQSDGSTVDANYIVAWNKNTSQWEPLGTSTQNGTNGTVRALASDGSGNIFVGGDFTSASDNGGTHTANHVTRWQPASSTWDTTGLATQGPSNSVYALVYDNAHSALYAGGNFGYVASTTTANNVAKWDGSSWSALTDGDGGISGVSGGNNTVYALAYDSSSRILYVGGDFATAGKISVQAIARWGENDPVWRRIDGTSNSTGPQVVSGAVYALQLNASESTLHVGGNFTQVSYSGNTTNANNIAVWNMGVTPNRWDTYSTGGVSAAVRAISFGGSSLLGGDFATVGNSAHSSQRFAVFQGVGSPTVVTLNTFEGQSTSLVHLLLFALMGMLLVLVGMLLLIASVMRRKRV